MTTSLTVTAGRRGIRGDLIVPEAARAIVVFAHGSGSGRFSPRNRLVAAELRKARLGTFLVDLLTEEEEAVDDVTAELRFDIPFLASRLEAASGRLLSEPGTRTLPQAYFGASTGAAAALVAASRRVGAVFAVVSRGGRPDLAASALEGVEAPTLLIVGGDDVEVLELNRRARARMRCPTRLEIVPGATHLFEEPGALEAVARLAAGWFEDHLPRGGA